GCEGHRRRRMALLLPRRGDVLHRVGQARRGKYRLCQRRGGQQKHRQRGDARERPAPADAALRVGNMRMFADHAWSFQRMSWASQGLLAAGAIVTFTSSGGAKYGAEVTSMSTPVAAMAARGLMPATASTAAATSSGVMRSSCTQSAPLCANRSASSTVSAST